MTNDFTNKMQKLSTMVNDMMAESRKVYLENITKLPDGYNKELIKEMMKKAESGESTPEELLQMMKKFKDASTK